MVILLLLFHCESLLRKVYCRDIRDLFNRHSHLLLRLAGVSIRHVVEQTD